MMFGPMWCLFFANRILARFYADFSRDEGVLWAMTLFLVFILEFWVNLVRFYFFPSRK